MACSSSPSAPPTVQVPPQPFATTTAPPSTAVAEQPPTPRAAPPAEAPEPDGPPAPPIRPIDPKMKIDSIGLLLGETNERAWLSYHEGSVVIDKATGCAIESYPTPPALVHPPKVTPGEILENADVLEGIRSIVGLGRRFNGQGHRFVLNLAWSPNGRHIVASPGGDLYRSSDGGQTFEPLEPSRARASRPAMSPDGKHLVYERCMPSNRAGCEYVTAALDNSRKPIVLNTSRQGHLLKMGATGTGSSTVFFTRTTMPIETCIDKFDLKTGTKESSRCIPLPQGKVTGIWPSQHFVDVSPNEKWGIVKWEEGRKNRVGAVAMTYVVSLVDMATGQLLREIEDVDGKIDDDGNMVLQTMTEGGGDHTYFYPFPKPGTTPTRKLLGNNSLSSYTNKVAMLHVFHNVSTLGASKCDLVKMVKTP